MNPEERVFDRNWQYFQRAMSAESFDDIERIVADFCALLGFRNFGFASKGSQGEDGYHYCTNFDAAWAAQYRTLNTPEAECTDLRIIQAKAWHPPSGWNSLGQNSYVAPPELRKPLKRRLIMTGEFGIHSGITVPLRAPGIDWAFLSLTSNQRHHPREFDNALLIATYFTNCLQAAISRIDVAATPDLALSAREREILRWSAIGKTSWETSTILDISERTVNFHLQRAAAKLGVKGRRAAVARAIALGIIRL